MISLPIGFNPIDIQIPFSQVYPNYLARRWLGPE